MTAFVESVADRRAACMAEQAARLAEAGVPEPEETVRELAGGLWLRGADTFCRRLRAAADGAVAEHAASKNLRKPPEELAERKDAPAPPAGRPEDDGRSLRARVEGLLLEVRRQAAP